MFQLFSECQQESQWLSNVVTKRVSWDTLPLKLSYFKIQLSLQMGFLYKNLPLGKAFDLVFETLTSSPGMPSFQSCPAPDSSVLLMHTLGGSKQWIQLSSRHPHKNPWLSFWLLASAWISLGPLRMFGQWISILDLTLCTSHFSLSFLLCLSAFLCSYQINISWKIYLWYLSH